MEKMIKKAHDAITRVKGKEYAPTSNEIQEWIYNQPLKLYTKKMFLNAAEKCEVSMIDAKHIMKYIDEYVTPIELPSDEEIKHISYTNNPYPIQKQMHIDWDNGFEKGAKWVIGKIKGGNNE